MSLNTKVWEDVLIFLGDFLTCLQCKTNGLDFRVNLEHCWIKYKKSSVKASVITFF